MKQIIPFVKDLNFDTKISEITSIALEHDLQMENNDSIVGIFTINGKYKINDISVNEENFEKNIDFDITLDDKYDASKVKIDIDDFYYEIINEEYLRVHIDVMVGNLVYYKKEEKPTIEIEKPILTTPEIKEDNVRNQEEITMITNDNVDTNKAKEDNMISEDNIRVDNDKKEIVQNLNASFLNNEEKYLTYKVHIIRNDETIDDIKAKYNIDTDELKKYNNIDDVVMGTKLVIPLSNE